MRFAENNTIQVDFFLFYIYQSGKGSLKMFKKGCATIPGQEVKFLLMESENIALQCSKIRYFKKNQSSN